MCGCQSFGLNATTIVSNTNTSTSTEEVNSSTPLLVSFRRLVIALVNVVFVLQGKGFGGALLDFVTELAGRDTLPQVWALLSPRPGTNTFASSRIGFRKKKKSRGSLGLGAVHIAGIAFALLVQLALRPSRS